ncbi:hypothetical protein Lal_00000913 [Lupinus albus]|nr:hypothetical protein Lal_00000913 [Lupinus albus]
MLTNARITPYISTNARITPCIKVNVHVTPCIKRKRSLRIVGHKQSNKVHRINRREETKNLVTGFSELCLRLRECSTDTKILLENKDYKP